MSSLLAVASAAWAAPDCKSSWGNAACPAPKAAKPLPSAKSAAATKPNAAVNPAPKPRPEPGVVRRAMPPGPSPKTTARTSGPRQQTSQADRRAMTRRSDVRSAHAHERNSEEAWRDFDAWRARSADANPPAARIYGYAPQAQAGRDGCGDSCQYREWLDQYRAWYDRYGRDYGRGRDLPPVASAIDPGKPAHEDGSSRPPARQSGMRADAGERNRLDPWHGYDFRDGPENGY